MLIEPSDQQALFEDVYSQMHQLHTHWWMYMTFFGGREAVEVVSRHTKFTFGRLQALLIEGIVLGLSRLLANAQGKQGQRSASIETLLRQMPTDTADVTRDLRKQLACIRTNCKSIDDWRDSLVAHRSYDVALQRTQLDKIQERTVRRALEDLSDLLTRVSTCIGAGLRCDFLPDVRPDVFDADVLLAKLASAPSRHCVHREGVTSRYVNGGKHEGDHDDGGRAVP